MHIIQLENILLSDQTPQAIVKIADFGLARFFADNSELRTVCGSPLYVAPEILDIGMSSETYTPAVDMWSVGVILFILLSVRDVIMPTRPISAYFFDAITGKLTFRK